MAGQQNQQSIEELRKRLDAAVKRDLPGHVEALAPKQDQLMQVEGFAGLDTSSISSVETSFCSIWRKAYPFLNLLIRGASWFTPAQTIAEVKTALNAINTEFVPLVCGPK
jgi:hypothetical protein